MYSAKRTTLFYYLELQFPVYAVFVRNYTISLSLVGILFFSDSDSYLYSRLCYFLRLKVNSFESK